MPINGRQPGTGRYLFGVLLLYHETKVPKPGVRDPLCLVMNCVI